MLKKLSLCLLLTTNLYPVEQTESDKLSSVVITAMILGAGIIALDLYIFANSDRLEKIISGDEKAVGEAINKITTAIAAAMGVLAIPELCSISKDTYEFIFPTEEQKAIKESETAAAIENIKYLKAEEKFVDCMITCKSESQINTSGLPVDCEELAHIFVACGGKNEVDKITHDLMDFRK